MNCKSLRKLLALTIIGLFLAGPQRCHAHFPWLTIEEDGHALMFFSESPAERDYHLPESVAEAKVMAVSAKSAASEVAWETLEKDKFVGRKSTATVPADATLSTNFTYGIYHGTLLSYYAYHLPPVGTEATGLPEEDRLALQASVAHSKTGMELTVTWKGEPLEGVGVTIIDAETESFEDKTDEHGKVSFSTNAEGLTGFVIGHSIKSASGTLDGEDYASESHYCTVTTNYQRPKNKVEAKQSAAYAPLPEALASFGAAVCDGWLYVYSGHIGKAHDHSLDNLSKGFHRLRLDGSSEWESLDMQTPLQGLPLVAHGGKLYRVGGLHATNSSGEDADMHSVDEFSCFDPQSGQWTSMPKLPQCRSSHDAVVIGDKLYVVGGWTLSGDSDGEWLDQMLVYDFSAADSSWQEMPSMPSKRRALATSHWNGKLIAMGGMDEDHSISRDVDCFDPSTSQWSKLATFPGEGMSGFGVSAWNVAGKLYASGSEGVVYRLSDDGQAWTKVAELDRPRFFHRLLAKDNSELLIIGGAPLDAEGHLNNIETIGL